MRRAILLLSMALVTAGEASAKCGNLIIRIEGRIEGGRGDDLRVVVDVTPAPNWEPQPEIPIKGQAFVGDALFDRTKSEERVRDACSRVPDSLDVRLLRKGLELSRVRLHIKQDFVREKGGNYNLRSPIVLHSR